jgi:hypothetical protein
VGLPETDFPKGWNRVDASVLGLALTAIAGLPDRADPAAALPAGHRPGGKPLRGHRQLLARRDHRDHAGRPGHQLEPGGREPVRLPPTRCWANRWPACSRPSAWPRS